MKEKILKFRKNKLAFYTSLVFVLLIVISLGTAILTRTLNIGGKAKIKESSWIIYFDDVRDVSASQSYDERARIVDLAKTRIEFEAELKNPGDYYEFYVDTVNDGTIDAAIDSIDKFEFTEEQKKYLELTVIDMETGLELKRCDTLLAGERKEVKAIVKFKDGLDLSEYPTEEQNLDLYFDIHYVQHPIDGCETIPRETKYKLTILPNGGTYNDRTTPTRVYMKENEEYTVGIPTRKLYNFDGWEVVTPNEDGDYDVVGITGDEDYTFTPVDGNTKGSYKFIMGVTPVFIRAKWIENDYVARIEDTYYTTIQAAFDSVDLKNPKTNRKWDDNTVWLLKDTTEYPTNNAEDAFTFNLDGHTVTGSITNSKKSNITMVNGRVETKNIEDFNTKINDNTYTFTEEERKDLYGFINYGTLNLGIDEGLVEVENSIALVGNQAGLYNYEDRNDETKSAVFNFYDGYLEGLSGIVGEYDDTPERYFVFSEYKRDINRTRVYLVRDSSRAVAKTYANNVIYHYNLQSAIDALTSHQKDYGTTREKDYKVDAIRNFEAAYELSVGESTKVEFDLVGFTVQTGEKITNEGNLKILNSKENQSTLKPSVTIENKGNLEIENINVAATADKDVILNSGKLDLSKVVLTAKDAYGVKNVGTGDIDIDKDTILKSDDKCGLYNTGSNLTIETGKVYCFLNEGTATVSGNVEYITFAKKTQPNLNNIQYVPAIRNTGTLNFDGGNVTTDLNTNMIENTATFNFNDGVIHSEYLAVSNTGRFNVNGSEVSSTKTAMSGGTIIVNGGDVKSETEAAITEATIDVKKGTVYTEEGETAIAGRSNVTVSGGTVRGTNYGIYYINNYYTATVTVTDGFVEAPKGIYVNTVNVKGGEVIGEEYGILTNNYTMTGGTVRSTEGIGVTINNTGNITGGEVYGATYGVLSKNTLTLGEDEGEISSTSPMLLGELYGLYIEGETTNFYDGILKGQTDGYYGPITGTPLGGVVFEGDEYIKKTEENKYIHSEETDEEAKYYNTDFIGVFKPWLRIGETTYNTLNAASEAISAKDEATIYVIDDADVLFAQKIIDENKDKKITLDLNGHKVTTTQDITNYSNLTITDSSTSENKQEDVGTGEGTLIIKKNNGIINYQQITINGGRFESITEQVIINKASEVTNDEVKKGIVINNATFSVSNNAILNGYYENNTTKSGYVVINGVNVENSTNFINNSSGNVVINGTKNKNTDEHTTVINSSNYAVINPSGTTTINGGKISAGNRVVSGDGSIIVNEEKNINLEDENQVASTELYSKDDYALAATYYGSVTVNGGTIVSEKNTAVYSQYYITINDGNITGTTGVYNTCHTISWWNMCIYGNVTITGGKITGTTDNGVVLTGDDGGNRITGGEIVGQTNGLDNRSLSTVTLGVKGGALDIKSPSITGIGEYGLNNTGYIYFYDGILKGKKKESVENSSHNGLISEVEDATMVVRDYEFINKQEYQTEYLKTQDDWLQVGEDSSNTYNTTDAASAAVKPGDKIYVIADTNIRFKQAINSDYDIDFDLNGHSVVFTQSITIKSPTTFEGEGQFKNTRTNMLVNQSDTKINSGNFITDSGDAIVSSGKLTVNGGLLH